MFTLMIIVHVVVSFALILIVLLQTGKGAEMGAGFGGGSNQTIFGSRGAATFLSKVTTGGGGGFLVPPPFPPRRRPSPARPCARGPRPAAAPNRRRSRNRSRRPARSKVPSAATPS